MEKENNEKSDVARREEDILSFWKENHIFEKSVETPAGSEPVGDFVFYDGPPFATGTPHYGHILAGTIKDAIPRFQTMQGKRVVRMWGWDCHGLPLENIIEKRLGLSTKRDIEEMGVKQFNESARGAVMEYESDWKQVVPRMGRFVDMENDYKTMDSTYTESVWWVFSELNKKGLVYEGFKSMHLCPRCGTTLSNFEVNQGYKDIKDIAVTVKMPLLDDAGHTTNTSILVWTTTPWTLPGNMAVAVHRDIDYVKVRMTIGGVEEFYILGKARLSQLGTDAYEVVEEMKGLALVGKRYAQPFEYLKKHLEGLIDPITEKQNDGEYEEKKQNRWKVWHADYVEIGEEGTGAVHIAPAYGEEDLNLALKEHIQIFHHVTEDGRFEGFVTDLSGQLVKPKDDEKSDVSHLDADIEIIRALKERNLLIKKENVTHSYPHCWRCDTPLLNYATTSWFVRVTDLKDALVRENEKVTWVPEYVGSNRFGKWLEGARDWAISRQRYWGAPLPIWRRSDTGAYTVIGSLEELKSKIRRSGNTYFMTRHGESEFNTIGKLNAEVGVPNGLTEAGKRQVDETIEKLKDLGIERIYHSPLERTTETARRIQIALNLPDSAVVADIRLREMGFGDFEGAQVDEYLASLGSGYNRLTTAPKNGESWGDVKRRVGEFLYEVERQMSHTKILIVSHGGTLQMLQGSARGMEHRELGALIEEDKLDFNNAELRTLEFVPLPHNDDYILDFHRPYIDEVSLVDTDGTPLRRVEDVFDCWFESGSMPYAQHHYPFEHKETFLKEKFPANFIAEGLDQTRGWFYSLIVLGVALFQKSPFEHVIVSGLTLAEDGKKMSKSLRNYPDPMELADRVGVDALRFYLLSSPVVRGEDLAVNEREVLELQRKNIGRLHNVLGMYEQYASDAVIAHNTSTHVLDRWILARLSEVTKQITNAYEHYELDKATRPLEGLIDDLSVWYLRRSRDRIKGEESEDKMLCLATLRYVLKQLAGIMAPVMPFYAEYLFLHTREDADPESVHLTRWAELNDGDSALMSTMAEIRSYATFGLKLRAERGVKVRQPLRAFWIKHTAETPLNWDECVPILRDELNVKEVAFRTDLPEEAPVADFDWEITTELKQEGYARELMRAVQDTRKEMGLNQEDRIILTISPELKTLIGSYEEEVRRVTGTNELRGAEPATPKELVLEEGTFYFEVTRPE